VKGKAKEGAVLIHDFLASVKRVREKEKNRTFCASEKEDKKSSPPVFGYHR
jgi:hypothetical protein